MTEPRHIEYNGIKWVGFMAYRVRRNETSCTYGNLCSYLVREAEVKPLPDTNPEK